MESSQKINRQSMFISAESSQPTQRNTQIKEKNFAYSFRSIYYLSRIFGLHHRSTHRSTLIEILKKFTKFDTEVIRVLSNFT